MTDRVYPSANKPAANGAANGTAPAANGTVPAVNGNGNSNTAFPATKSQLYNAGRPPYRPRPPSKRHRRSCCCSCCLWTTLIIVILIFLVALAGVVFYLLYRPHRPSFTVSSLQLSRFNLTDTDLTSRFNLTLIARNRNSDITFFYDPIAVKFISGDVDIGDGSFAGFTHGKKNVTALRTVVSSSSPLPVGTDVTALRSSLRSRNLPVKVQLDTKVKVKIGKIDTKKLRIRVICDGITVSIPTGNATTVARTSNMKCKVDPRIKIFKWTI